MTIHNLFKSALLSATAFFLIATCVDAAPKKRQQFESFVPVISSQSIKSGQYCGNLAGVLSSGEFFDGLQRVGTGRHIEFRKGAQPVKEFPSTIAISLAGKIAPCASERSGSGGDFARTGNGSSQQELNEFTNGLKFTAQWVNPRGVQPVSDWSVTKSVSDGKSWGANDQIPTRFAFQVPSQGVPLTNQLEITVYLPSGVKLATFTAGVLSRMPKKHWKTIYAHQGE
jgi:hypothetical protein